MGLSLLFWYFLSVSSVLCPFVSSFPIFFCLEYFYILFYSLYWLINYISSSNHINILSIINTNISNIYWHKKFLFLHDLLQSAVYLIAGRIAYQQIVLWFLSIWTHPKTHNAKFSLILIILPSIVLVCITWHFHDRNQTKRQRADLCWGMCVIHSKCQSSKSCMQLY